MTVQDVKSPIVHKVGLMPGDDARKAKTRIDEIFDEREERAAKRFSAAELEKMALESENEVAKLRGEPPKYRPYGGETMNDEEKTKQDEKQTAQREKLMAHAKLLIDGGMEPAQVGQMLMGLAPTGAAPIPAQGMGLDDVLKIVSLVVNKNEADELKDVIADLTKKVEDMTKNPPRSKDEVKPLDPISFARQQAEAVTAWNEALEALRPAPVAGVAGESLEVTKEKNRHSEKMEEIKIDSSYKQGLVEVVGDIPERIGRGLAGHQSEENSGNGGGNGGGLSYIICSEDGCGTKIFVSPDAKQIECTKCGAIFAAGDTINSQVEE